MLRHTVMIAVMALLGIAPAHAMNAMNAKYAQQLERSGCTQASEMQGCDIHKTKAQNAAAGLGSPATATRSTYAGNWRATTDAGATIASIRIDARDHVWVNNKKVRAKKSDGTLIFKDGMITYTIQADPNLQSDNRWVDNDAGTKGSIQAN